MLSIQGIGNALATSFVAGGNLQFTTSYSPEDLMCIHNKFMNDLLSYNIPNWRVVGFYHGWDDKHGKSVFRCNDIYGCSLIELGQKLNLVIPESNGGIDPEVGCFYGADEEVENLKEFDEAYGISSTMRAGTKRANILKFPKEVIGSLAANYQVPPDERDSDGINTDQIWYTQFSLVEEPKWPRMLLPHKRIANLVKKGMGDPAFFMFIKEGTGSLSYAETQKFFSDKCERIMSCNTSYDLSKFFMVRNPVLSGGGNSLQLIYLTEINENVLTTIIQNYGRRLS